MSIRILYARTQSPDANPITVIEYEVPLQTLCQFDVILTSSRTGANGVYKGSVAYGRAGGAPSIIGAAVYQPDQETAGNGTMEFDLNGNSVRVRFTPGSADPRTLIAELRIQEGPVA